MERNGKRKRGERGGAEKGKGREGEMDRAFGSDRWYDDTVCAGWREGRYAGGGRLGGEVEVGIGIEIGIGIEVGIGIEMRRGQVR